jgi:hypothetical protein
MRGGQKARAKIRRLDAPVRRVVHLGAKVAARGRRPISARRWQHGGVVHLGAKVAAIPSEMERGNAARAELYASPNGCQDPRCIDPSHEQRQTLCPTTSASCAMGAPFDPMKTRSKSSEGGTRFRRHPQEHLREPQCRHRKKFFCTGKHLIIILN